MSKLTPPDSAKQTPTERVASAKWQYWIARVVPMLFVTSLTIVIPRMLTQPWGKAEYAAIQEQKLQQRLRAISVKVLANSETIGSGVLLKRQQQVYTVVTNAHVIQAASAPFQIQTPDGQVYAATLLPPPSGQNRDLSVLRFQSAKGNYPIATLASSSPKVGDRIWSSGFPLTGSESAEVASTKAKAPWGLEIVDGKITQVLPIAITGGYGIGFDRAIKKGMSGGPAIDRSGELVGINGLHSNPLWDIPETLENGSTVSDALQEQIDNSSWAIPIEFVKDYASL
jgi:S1-C subfamily serine protease